MENTTQTPAPKSSTGWKVVGIIALVFGILSILFAFIPCLGAYAMYTGILSAILSIVGLVMANNAKASKTISIIALVVSLASIGVGYWRYTQLKQFGASLEKIGNDLSDSLKKQGIDIKDTVTKK